MHALAERTATASYALAFTEKGALFLSLVLRTPF